MRIEGGVHCWTDSISFPLLCVYDICDCANSSSPYLMANDFLLVLILLIMTPNYILMYIGGIRVGLSTLIFVANMGGIMIFFCKTVVAIQLTLLYKQIILLNNLLVLIKNIVTQVQVCQHTMFQLEIAHIQSQQFTQYYRSHKNACFCI